MSDNTAADEGCPVEYFDFKKNLPKPVLERINAVKNVTQEITDVEQKFHEELHALEVKYNAIYRYKKCLCLILLAIVHPDGNQTTFSRALLDANFGPLGRN